MNEVQAKIERLLDPQFLTKHLSLHCDEGYIAAYVTSFYLEEADLEKLRPLLKPPEHHADVGQVGCFYGKPIFPIAKWNVNGQPFEINEGVHFTYWVYREVLPVSSFRDWLRERKEDEEKKKLAFRALGAYEDLAARTTITKGDLTPVVEAARSRHFVSWDIGMRFLSRIAAKEAPARETMCDLMTNGKPEERVRVLGTLWDHLPKSFCIKLLRQGLKDRSKLVRQAAANVSRCLILSEMIAELGQTASIEQHPQTKWQLERAIALIRDGYHQYAREDGTQVFVVRISDGFPAKLLYPIPGWCTQTDIDQKGVHVVAEEVRRLYAGATERKFNWPIETGADG